VLWSASGKATVLQDAGGGQGGSVALAINDAGQSVGDSFTPSGGLDAVLWSPSGKATVLQDVGGQGVSGVEAINDSGWSVGSSETGSNRSGSDAVLWSPSGKATVLQTPGSQGFNAAKAINASGWSVGSSVTLTSSEAVLWSPSGKATVLQYPGGQGYSYAEAINDAGWSVGISDTASGVCNPFGEEGCSYEAVLWSPSGKATNLGAILGSAWTDTFAVGLNGRGDIIGYGDYHGGRYGFLLAPVPEPSTWMMMLAGFAGLGFAGYRRAKAGHATLAA